MPPRSFLLAIVAATAALLGYQLFVPPIVGLADQGDFVRTIGRFGYGPLHRGSLKYIYVEPEYVRDPLYRSPAWEQASSEYPFVGAAVLAKEFLSKSGTLDIRLMGLVHALALLAAFARLLLATEHSRARALVWIGAAVALTDAGYAAYLNSFYQEPAACTFFLLLLAESVAIGVAGKASLASVIRWSLWAVLLALAKAQNAPLGLVLGLFAFRLASWASSRQARVAAVIGGSLAIGCGVWDVLAMPVRSRMAPTYDVIFAAILPDSKTPAADLRALGLDPGLARYTGTLAWGSGTGFQDPAVVAALSQRVSPFTVARFYLARPGRMWRRLKAVLPKITFLRPEWYGNFEPSAGLAPAALSRACNLWSGFHEHALARVGRWLVLALAGWPLAAAWLWARSAGGARRMRLELCALLPVCCLVALGTVVYGDAFDTIKHAYLFNLMLDACLLGAAAYFFCSSMALRLAISRFSRRSRATIIRT